MLHSVNIDFAEITVMSPGDCHSCITVMRPILKLAKTSNLVILIKIGQCRMLTFSEMFCILKTFGLDI